MFRYKFALDHSLEYNSFFVLSILSMILLPGCMEVKLQPLIIALVGVCGHSVGEVLSGGRNVEIVR